MTFTEHELGFRLHNREDTATLVTMINRDPYHLLNGVTAETFEQDLDAPGERVRENTFVVVLEQKTVAYFSLIFVDRGSFLSVYCYGTVDVDRRRQGIGSAMFKFIFTRLQGLVRQEAKPIHLVHRALTTIPGEAALGLKFGMQEQNTLEIMCLKDMTRLTPSSLSSDFYFRPPELEDAASWAELYNAAFGGNRTVESVIHEFQGALFSPQLYMLCIHKTGDPIGLLCSTLKGAHARIPTLAVKKEWQRRGIAEAMLGELLYRLSQAGARDVRLSVESTNSAAKFLYHKLGFQQDYRRVHYKAVFTP